MKPELEKIYNTAFDLIEIRLKKKEQVYPFSIYLIKGAENPVISMQEATSGDTQKLLVSLREELRAKASKVEMAAFCICYDMHITDPRTNEKTDAILIELVGEGNITKKVYIPYNFQDEVIIKKPFEETILPEPNRGF